MNKDPDTMLHPVKSPKKLIEVALPLDAINAAAAKEKSIRHGHPSTLHLWWARRPLAAARAVLFAQLVNDPSGIWELEHPGQVAPPNLRASWAASRKRLFGIIEPLVLWENTTNETVLEQARQELRKSWREVCALNSDHPEAATLFNPDHMPGLHDPFAGGGTIPLEAQRLGLEAFASDLNPVAVLINKAMIEIPPKFAGRPPVHPDVQDAAQLGQWTGAKGLAEDVRRYGAWMRQEAQKRIGHLYPPVLITAEMARERPDLKPLVGQQLTVIAWLWARTVKSPNPAFSHIEVPLASTFVLSSKEGKESYVEPVIAADGYRFTVKTGTPPQIAYGGTTAGKRAGFRCLLSDSPIGYDYIRNEGQAGRVGKKLMAIVAEGRGARIYLSPSSIVEEEQNDAEPTWKPATAMNGKCLVNVGLYGLTHFHHIFTPRQLVALTTFSDLVAEARERVEQDYRARQDYTKEKTPGPGTPLSEGGSGARAYADAVGVYLGFAISRSADRGSSLCSWDSSPKMEALRNTFGRQALPMIWDFAEGNHFSNSSGNWLFNIEWVSKTLDTLVPIGPGKAHQADAQFNSQTTNKFVSTDPPYYDNIGYADLSDFFYVWLRRSLRDTYPDLFSTLAVPKAEELVATPYRHGSKDAAESFFLQGMTQAMRRLAEQAHPSAPITIYYAFKQSETEQESGTSSSGWETFLQAVNEAGLSLTGTWPMRTELGNRMIGSGTNALASSIVLVCRKRRGDAPIASRRQFMRELQQVLPRALDEMVSGSGEDRSPVAPVDLSQAIIGPGMAVFSKYAAVLEADGTPMSVRTALQLINRFLAESDFDADTQFCVHWFEQHGWLEGPFGEADVLARAKSTGINALVAAGVVAAGGGKVRILRFSEYPTGWEPSQDTRLADWELLHHLIRIYRTAGEAGVSKLLKAAPARIEAVRLLAFRLFTLCDRKGWAEEARAYNELMSSWEGIELAMAALPEPKPKEEQLNLYGGKR